jgi:hypothetical protein
MCFYTFTNRQRQQRLPPHSLMPPSWLRSTDFISCMWTSKSVRDMIVQKALRSSVYSMMEIHWFAVFVLQPWVMRNASLKQWTSVLFHREANIWTNQVLGKWTNGNFYNSLSVAYDKSISHRADRSLSKFIDWLTIPNDTVRTSVLTRRHELRNCFVPPLTPRSSTFKQELTAANPAQIPNNSYNH